MVSLTHGRLSLSVAVHLGDTMSITQAENLVAEAERRLGLHPRWRIELQQERIVALEKAEQPAQERPAKQRDALDRAEKRFQQHLERFEQDNAALPNLPEIAFRLDAGIGTYENVALLIESGYEVYTKPPNQKVVDYLRRRTGEETA
jgi:hypothetical protein